MLALAEHEDSLCKCGFPKSVADEDPDLEITHRVCPVCAGLDRAFRIQEHQDSEAVRALGQKPPPDAVLPTDGRHLGLRFNGPPDNE